MTDFTGFTNNNIVAFMTSENSFEIPLQQWTSTSFGMNTLITLSGTGSMTETQVLNMQYYDILKDTDTGYTMSFQCTTSGTK